MNVIDRYLKNHGETRYSLSKLSGLSEPLLAYLKWQVANIVLISIWRGNSII